MRPIYRLVSATALASAVALGAASATVHGNDLGAQVEQQLAMARAATAKYHDVNVALADGYVFVGVNPTEDDVFEFLNFSLVDCTLDVTQPEALRYVESGDRLRLVAVEYAIPMACSPDPPTSFLTGAGEWEQEAGVPVWMLGVPVWSGSSSDSQ